MAFSGDMRVRNSSMERTPLLDDTTVNVTQYESDDETVVQSPSAQVKRYKFDDVVDLIGFGRFHVLLICICGWANASDAVEVMCLSLVLPSAKCELGLTSEHLGWLSSGMFVGMMIGGYLWGGLGDALGRRNVLFFALLLNGVFGVISSFAQTFTVLLLCRIISGIGVGGSVPVVWSYFVEFAPNRYRGGMLSCLAAFWMIGQLVVTAFAWIIIPHTELSTQVGSLRFDSWRIFLVLATVTSLSSSFLIFLLPKSPKYLLQKGRHDEALEVLRRIYCQNHGRNANEFPVRYLEMPEKKVKGSLNVRSVYGRVVTVAKDVISQTLGLFREPIWKMTAALIVINFVLAFGYYGLSLWFPELFAKARAAHVGSICNAPTAAANSTASTGANCTVDESVFRDNFLISLSSLPGNLLTILFMDSWGRKPFFVVGIILSAGSAFFIWFVSQQIHVLIMSCVFSAVSVVCWNCLDAWGTELFPTNLRATSMGICLVFARIGAILGNLAFGYLIDVHCAIPLLLVAVFLGVGGVVSLFLPNTTRTSIK